MIALKLMLKNVKMTKNGEYVRFNKYARKIKPPFIIYTDFESVLVSENNEKQNREEY